MDGLQLNIDGLGDLANQIAKKVVDLLLDNSRIQRLLNSSSTSPPDEIYGIGPYELYSTAEVAERFHMSNSGIRNLPEEDLPRAPWSGFENRYRGIDILRFEGVPVEDYLPVDQYLDDIDGEKSESARKPKKSPRHDAQTESSSPVGDRLPRSRASDKNNSGCSSSREYASSPEDPDSEDKNQKKEAPINHPNLPEL